MAKTAQAYGLIPINHPTGQNRASKYVILNNAGTGYGTSIYKGDLVKIGTDGTIQRGDGASAAIGVFAGCEYIDATGKPVSSPYWPASTAVMPGSEIKAYVYDDPATVYRIGVTANASGYLQAVVGQHANVTLGTGNVNTGVSGSSVTAAAVAAGTAGMVRILGFFDGQYDATENPYPQLLVQINLLQFAANAVGV